MTQLLARAARTVRTVRHLRARQLAHQVLRLVRPTPRVRDVAVTWDVARAPRILERLAALGPVGGAAHAMHRARAWLDGRVVGLGLDVAWTGDWRMAGPSPLWRYHLQYHEHLADLAWYAATAGDRAAFGRLNADLRGWRASWGAGTSPAWDAYPVSVRIGSWLRILAWGGVRLDEGVRTELQAGIARHVAVLSRALEWHLDGNHLLRNAWALALGSSVLGGTWAERRRSAARALFARTMAEQVHADGWHEERSPMYHIRALRDALELAEACEAAGERLDDETAARMAAMAGALAWMLRADGSLWALNDSAGDHGVDLAPLLARSVDADPQGVRHFTGAGAVVLIDRVAGDRMRLDLGAPAPAHQPGHAHAGALGFELDLAGQPCVVDGGCSGYDEDPWRPYFRGTGAHSTVVIDGRDQSELWATFRVGGRAHVQDVSCEGGEREFKAAGTCRPWHLPAAAHRREFRRDGRSVTVTDVVHGTEGRTVEGFVHFDPSWSVQRTGDATFALTHVSARAALHLAGAVTATLHRGEERPTIGWRAPGFNQVVPSWSLRVRSTGLPGEAWHMTITPE